MDDIEYAILDEAAGSPKLDSQLLPNVSEDVLGSVQDKHVIEVENDIEPLTSEQCLEIKEKLPEALLKEKESASQYPDDADQPCVKEEVKVIDNEKENSSRVDNVEAELVGELGNEILLDDKTDLSGTNNPFLRITNSYPKMFEDKSFLLPMRHALLANCMDALKTFLVQSCQIVCSLTYKAEKVALENSNKNLKSCVARLQLRYKGEDFAISNRARYQSDARELIAKKLILLISRHSKVIVTKKFTELICRHVRLDNISERMLSNKFCGITPLANQDDSAWMMKKQHKIWLSKLQEATKTFGVNTDEWPLINPTDTIYLNVESLATINMDMINTYLTPILNNYTNNNDLSDLVFTPEANEETQSNINKLINKKFSMWLYTLFFQYEGKSYLIIRKFAKNYKITQMVGREDCGMDELNKNGPYKLFGPGELTEDFFGPLILTNNNLKLFCFNPDPCLSIKSIKSKNIPSIDPLSSANQKMMKAQQRLNKMSDLPDEVPFPTATNYTLFSNFPPTVNYQPSTPNLDKLSFLKNSSMVIENRQYECGYFEVLSEFGNHYKVPFNVEVKRIEDDTDSWVATVSLTYQKQVIEVATATDSSEEKAKQSSCQNAIIYLSTICNIIIRKTSLILNNQQVMMGDLTGAAYQQKYKRKNNQNKDRNLAHFRPTEQTVKQSRRILLRYVEDVKLNDLVFSTFISKSNLQFVFRNAFHNNDLKDQLEIVAFKKSSRPYLSVRKRLHPRTLTDILFRKSTLSFCQYKLYRPGTLNPSFMWLRGDDIIGTTIATEDRRVLEHYTPMEVKPSVVKKQRKRARIENPNLNIYQTFNKDKPNNMPLNSNSNPYKYYKNPVPIKRQKLDVSGGVSSGRSGSQVAVPFGYADRVPFTRDISDNRQPHFDSNSSGGWDEQHDAGAGFELDGQPVASSSLPGQSFVGNSAAAAACVLAPGTHIEKGRMANVIINPKNTKKGNRPDNRRRFPARENKYGRSYCGVTDTNADNQLTASDNSWSSGEYIGQNASHAQGQFRSESANYSSIFSNEGLRPNGGNRIEGGSYGISDRNERGSFGGVDRNERLSQNYGNRSENGSFGDSARNMRGSFTGDQNRRESFRNDDRNMRESFRNDDRNMRESFGGDQNMRGSFADGDQNMRGSIGECDQNMRESFGECDQSTRESFGGDNQHVRGSFGGSNKNMSGNFGGGNQNMRGSFGGSDRNTRESFGGSDRNMRGSFGGSDRNMGGSFGGNDRNMRGSFGGSARNVRGSFGGGDRNYYSNYAGDSDNRSQNRGSNQMDSTFAAQPQRHCKTDGWQDFGQNKSSDPYYTWKQNTTHSNPPSSQNTSASSNFSDRQQSRSRWDNPKEYTSSSSYRSPLDEWRR